MHIQNFDAVFLISLAFCNDAKMKYIEIIRNCRNSDNVVRQGV